MIRPLRVSKCRGPNVFGVEATGVSTVGIRICSRLLGAGFCCSQSIDDEKSWDMALE